MLARIERLAAESDLPNPAALAHLIGLLIDGAIIAAMVMRNPKVADDAGAVLRTLLGSEQPRNSRVPRRRLAAAAV